MFEKFLKMWKTFSMRGVRGEQEPRLLDYVPLGLLDYVPLHIFMQSKCINSHQNDSVIAQGCVKINNCYI